MLAPSNPHIPDIMRIRDVLIDRAYNAPGADMKYFMHDCGTPSCVLGHVVCDPAMGMRDLIPYVLGEVSWGPEGYRPIRKVCDRLGIPLHGDEGLFGTLCAREERKAICDRIIERMLAEVSAT